MEESPLVSVIIPFFSREKGRLQLSVKSALAQTLQDIEVIVVDDASPVSAESEIANVLDKRLSIVRHEVNKNGAIARNTGIDRAKGQFVAFLDYDDVWHPEKLERQTEAFYHINDDRCVLYSRCHVVDGERQYIRPEYGIKKGEMVGDYLFVRKQIIQTSGIFLRADVARLVRFDNLKRHQDYQFCLALEEYGCSFYMMEQPLYQFVQIPKKNDPFYAIEWLSNYRKYMSPEAESAFKSLVVMRAMVASEMYGVLLGYAWEQKMLLDGIKVFLAGLMKRWLPDLVHILKRR